jgi:hypothetical protein
VIEAVERRIISILEEVMILKIEVVEMDVGPSPNSCRIESRRHTKSDMSI